MKNQITFKDWLLIIAVSALTLIVVVTVMMGIQALVIDTGRAIVH